MALSVGFLRCLYFSLHLKTSVLDTLSLFTYSDFVWLVILVYASLVNSLQVYYIYIYYLILHRSFISYHLHKISISYNITFDHICFLLPALKSLISISFSVVMRQIIKQAHLRKLQL